MNSSNPSRSDAMHDPIERIGDAAKRLGINVWTLRSRAKALGFKSGRAGGRPKDGEVAGLRRSEWNQCAGTRVRGRPRKTETVSRQGRRWTPEDSERLSDLWGMVDSTEVCLALGRSWDAILKQSEVLGLPSGLPSGMVTMLEAEKILGHNRASLANIAHRNGVEIRPHPCPRTRGSRHGGVRWRCVNLDALRAAVEREDRETETVHAAALQRGIPDDTLRRWLREAGLIPPCDGDKAYRRVASADVDRVVAARRSLEMTTTAAKRVNVNVSTLRLWIRKSGLRKPKAGGRSPWLDPRQVDAVVARNRMNAVVNTRRPMDVECA